MGRLATIGFELDTLTSGVEITTHGFTGSVLSSLSQTHVHGGAWAQSWAATSQRGTDDYQFSTGSGTVFAQGWFYFTGNPNGNCTLLEFGSAAASLGGIYMNSSGQLGTVYFVGSTATYDTTVTTTMSQNTWHYLEVGLVATGTNAQTIVTRLDGVQISSKSGTATFAANGITIVVWGVFCLSADNGGAGTGTISTFYFDDLVVNDNTGSFQNTWPGGTTLVRVLPSGAGDSNTFATQVGGTAGSANNYTRVDEVTPDNATSYNASNTLAVSDLFVVGSSSIASGSTINVVQVGGVVANITGVDTTTAMEFQAERASGGTIATSSPIVPDATTWATNGKSAPHNYPLTLYQDPTSTNWTTATIASMQIGYKISTIHTDAIGITSVWAYVDYTPSTLATNGNMFLVM